MVNRINWIDALKGFAILTVVLGHCFGGALNAHYFNNDTTLMKSIYDFIYSFHMPLFFSASGFLFYLTKTYQKYKTKTVDIALMYIFWMILTWVIKYVAGGSINHPVTYQTLVTNVYNPTFIYWYLYALMLMYLLFSLIGIKKITINTLCILGLVACAVKILPVKLGIISTSMYYGYFFALGGYWVNNEKFKNINISSIIFSAFIICGNIYFYLNNIAFTKEIEIIKSFILANSAIILTYYLFINYKFLNIFKIFGVYSLHIYLIHDFLVAGTRMIFVKSGNENLVAYIFIGMLLGSVIPILIGKICKNKGILNYPFAPIQTIKLLR